MNDKVKPSEDSDIQKKKELLEQSLNTQEKYYSTIMETKEEIYSLIQTMNNIITIFNDKMVYFDMVVTQAEEQKKQKK